MRIWCGAKFRCLPLPSQDIEETNESMHARRLALSSRNGHSFQFLSLVGRIARAAGGASAVNK